ncbi:MAG: hypothetical protein E7459_08795 [Ruminococcaceae bacterium]|nr:hypothetical protein [Oscillospiraceae bacterium]
MNPLRQLFRQPIKTLMGIILLALSGAILCVSVGQFWASAQTLNATEQGYVTVALTTDKYTRSEVTDDNGNVISVTISSHQPFEVRKFIEGLPELAPELVQFVANSSLVSGYCPELTPLLYSRVHSASIEGGGNVPMDSPYDTAILEITLNEIAEIQEIRFADVQNYQIELTGTIERTVKLHEEYDDPTGKKLHLSCSLSSAMTVESLGLEIGKRYLVYGYGYGDEDWTLRCNMADTASSWGVSLEPHEISWEEDIRYLTQEEIEEIQETGLAGSVAIFSPDGNADHGVFLTEENLANIHASALSVVAHPSLLVGSADGKVMLWTDGALEEMTAEEYATIYPMPSFEEVTRDSESQLRASPVWSQMLQETEINNHAFPILATGNVQAIGQFATQKARITEGRNITQEEYEQGLPVCLISESLATTNGIEVGDSLPIKLYEGDSAAPLRAIFQATNPSPNYYSTHKGFAQEKNYTVVGFYRQSNEWSSANGSFTPNTIIVPERSVECATEVSTDGVFSTLVLYNGVQQQMEELVSQAGYEGLFTYDDQGYSRIVENLDAYSQVSQTVLLVGIGAWFVVVLLYMVLFPLQMKREVKRMWTLGTPRGAIFCQVFFRNAGIALAGMLLAAGAGLAGMNWVLSRLTAAAESELILTVTPAQIVILCCLSLAAELVFLALCGMGVVRHREDDVQCPLSFGN